jgi:hypothetical protein
MNMAFGANDGYSNRANDGQLHRANDRQSHIGGRIIIPSRTIKSNKQD